MRNPIHFFKLAASLFRLTRNLENLDRVLEMHEDILKLGKKEEIKAIVDEVKQAPQVVLAFKNQIRFPRENGDAFLHYPVGTLGHAYGQFLIRNGISPASFPNHEIKTDVDYLVMHTYETHDLWHVLTGYETGIEEELELQAFYAAQTPGILPIFILIAALLNTALFDRDKKNIRFDSISRGWQRGKQAKNLIGIDWVQYLDQPLAQVRSEFHLAPATSTVFSSNPLKEAFV